MHEVVRGEYRCAGEWLCRGRHLDSLPGVSWRRANSPSSRYNFRYKTCRWSVLHTLVVESVGAGVVCGELDVWWMDGSVMGE